MNKYSLIVVVAFVALFSLKAQDVMSVFPLEVESSQYNVSELERLTFPGGCLEIKTSDNGVFTFLISEVSHITFGDLTSSNEEHLASPKKSMDLYPVPMSNQLHINYASEQASCLQILVFDLNGQRVLSRQEAVNVGANVLELDVSPLKSGVYLVKIIDGNQCFTQRVIKQ